jgi:hypothetical protein
MLTLGNQCGRQRSGVARGVRFGSRYVDAREAVEKETVSCVPKSLPRSMTSSILF